MVIIHLNVVYYLTRHVDETKVLQNNLHVILFYSYIEIVQDGYNSCNGPNPHLECGEGRFWKFIIIHDIADYIHREWIFKPP